jgi:hypothetical protein
MKKLDGISAALSVGGLILWYAGGSNAGDQLIDGAPQLPLALPSILALVVGTGLAFTGNLKKAAGSGLFFGCAVLIVLSSALPLANQLFDSSEPSARRAKVVRLKEAAKGPDDLVLELDGKTASFWASRAPTCEVGAEASLVQRKGAFGWRWVESIECVASAGETIEIERMDEVERALIAGALVVFDIDNTLIEPAGMLGSDQWYYALVEQLQKDEKLDEDTAIDRATILWNEVQRGLAVRPVEATVPALIEKWAARDIRIVALTARTFDIADATKEHLRSVGIDFSKKKIASDLDLGLERPAKLIDGIVYLGEKNDKGEVLIELLRALNLRPTRVIFVDDKKKHVESVSASLARTFIPYSAFRYAAADANVAAFRADAAAVEYQRWKETKK